MARTIATWDDTQQVGTFLRGWGGVAAVILGLVLAFALSPLMNQAVALVHGAFVSLGTSPDAATMTLYWLGMISIGVGFFIALVGSDRRMDRLRGGVGDWSTLVQETLVVLGVALFWVFAGATWANYVDEFNTYEASIELPAIGLLLLMIAGAVLVRWIRRHRSSDATRAS